MVDNFSPKIKNAWEKWNIRGTILLSLSLQIFLILLAPYRKSTKKGLLILLIWSAYLLADSAANFTVGLISRSQGRDSDSSHGHKQNEDLLAFWAPFLLLHLGGPDTITAFSLEDNELWLRHLLGLSFQAVAAIYVFIQSVPNVITIPTVLMFLAGIIKYLERTRALYLASLDKFRGSLLREPDPGPNYEKLMEEYAQNKRSTQIIKIPETDKEAAATKQAKASATDRSEKKDQKKGPLKDLEVVYHAYKFFQIFKGLVVDLIFDFHERNKSRKFFEERKAEDALRVIEVELNLIYEALYTKVEVVHSSWGYIFRGIAFGSILASLVVFHSKFDEQNFKDQLDVRITYTLLWGAIALDLLALFMLIFSDRTFASIGDPNSKKGWFAKIYKGIFAQMSKSFFWWKRPSWQSHRCKIRDTGNRRKVVEFVRQHKVMVTPILFSRWSGSFASYNLMSYCLKSHPSRIHKIKRWPRLFAEKILHCLYIEGCYRFVVGLIKAALHAVKRFLSPVIHILVFIKIKLTDAIDVVVKKLMRISIIRKISVPFIFVRKYIMGLVNDLNDVIDEIIYVSWEPLSKELWEFIFTELRNKAVEAEKSDEEAKFISGARGDWVLTNYSETKIDLSNLLQYVSDVTYDESLLLWHIATDLCYHTPGEKPVDNDSFDHREFSKLLSDYMLYLLIMQPTTMSAVGGIGKIRFRDTCAEAERFFDRRGLLLSNVKNKEARASEATLSVNTDVKPEAVKGDRSKSVLFDASMLAKELNFLEKRGLNKWKLISRVWVELTSYAASHCRANTHARQLSKGGELITFIWLLMAHLGLGEQFQIKEGHGTAKLIAVD